MSKIYSYREWHQKIYEDGQLSTEGESDKPAAAKAAPAEQWNDGHLDPNQYEDVKSKLTVFTWKNTEAIIKCAQDPSYSVSATDLFNSVETGGSSGDYSKVTYLSHATLPPELKTQSTLLKIAGPDQQTAAQMIHQKCTSGEWEVLPKRAWSSKDLPGGFFKWMPTDTSCQNWRIEPIISKQFGGPIAWVFDDNAFCKMNYSDAEVKQTPGKSKGVALNGFIKNSPKKTNPFKPGDVVYINISENMVDNSGATQEQKDWMNRMGNVTKISGLKPDMENETMKDIVTKYPDLVITEVGHPAIATPPMGGYILLLERGGNRTGGGIGPSIALYQQKTF